MALDLDEGLREAFDEGKEVVIITVCESGRHRWTAKEADGSGFERGVGGGEVSGAPVRRAQLALHLWWKVRAVQLASRQGRRGAGLLRLRRFMEEVHAPGLET